MMKAKSFRTSGVNQAVAPSILISLDHRWIAELAVRTLGQFQSVILAEMDGPRERSLKVQFLGE
jgi:thiamine phosphate synthase YjbQ (UPF0047 family)